ncbi:MAG: polysaccharide pyruvyl transferase family protein [Rhodocyclaceae bacterium]|nr:polysaccharide pyruvyl transferase family protein [Rhodocyclaceae bacterium]
MRSGQPGAALPWAVVYAGTSNVGDEIQTLAAMHFLNRKGTEHSIVLDREDLASYSGPACKALMNGWYMHRPDQFPPAPQITPIFISFHCANERLIARNVDYFKAHEPIGCRDLSTQAMLQRYGIDAWFTGCLTLYFRRPQTIRRSGKYIVDVNSCHYIPRVDADLSAFADHQALSHEIVGGTKRTDVRMRLAAAARLLDQYRRAESVVTSRLHVALPCRAFDTPCLFLHSNIQGDRRFAGLQDVLAGGSKPEEACSTAPDAALARIIEGFDSFRLA